MDLTLELQEVVNHLDDDKKRLLIAVARGFLFDDGFDVLTDEDLRDIAIAEQELANGEAVNHNDINWD